MKSAFSNIDLARALVSVSRPEVVDPTKTYSILGAHWYAKGLYIKDVLPGSAIQAKHLYRVEENDFVYNRLFGWKGSFAIATRDDDGCYVSNEFPCFTINPETADGRYIWRYFSRPSVWDEVFSLSTGGTPTSRNRLKEEQLLRMEIPLPPIEEQRRIVERIEQVAGQLNEARDLRCKAVAEAEALVSSSTARLFEPKAGWITKAVGDFCDPPQYGFTESATDERVGPQFLRITDIQDGRVDWSRVPYCRCPSPAKYLLKSGDLVFARTGATTGKSFVIRDCPEAVFASYLIRLRVRDSVSVDYLYHYFQSSSYWAQIADQKKGTGQPNLNGSKLAKLRVPVAPLAEQGQIVSELASLRGRIDELKALQAETSKELDALMPSILDKAFRGEL
jgi:type I restriction enzyme S subunit